MKDRELLEMAAKAAGVYLPSDFQPEHHQWNPLTYDGDALRLAVKLGIAFRYERNAPPELRLPRECAIAITTGGMYFAEASEDKYAATRRAIVRAAAEIGKAVP